MGAARQKDKFISLVLTRILSQIIFGRVAAEAPRPRDRRGHEQSPWRHQNHSREPHEGDGAAVVDVSDPAPLHRVIFLRSKSLLSAFSWRRKKPWMNSFFLRLLAPKVRENDSTATISWRKHFDLLKCLCLPQPWNFLKIRILDFYHRFFQSAWIHTVPCREV